MTSLASQSRGPFLGMPIPQSSLSEPFKYTSRQALNRTPNPSDFRTYEPIPRSKPQAQEQVREDVLISMLAEKPVGYYIVLKRPARPVVRFEEPSPNTPFLARKTKSGFAFGCLPNNKPRATPKQELQLLQSIPTPQTAPPSTKRRPGLGSYPSYERYPEPSVKAPKTSPSQSDLNRTMRTTPRARPVLKQPATVENTSPVRKNPRGQYPDYELSY